MSAENWKAPLLLLALLLGVAALLPPELYPAGMALEVSLAGGLGWLLLRDEPPLPSSEGRRLALLAVAFLLPSILLSTQRHTSEAALFQLMPAGAAFFAARRESRSRHGREAITLVLIALGSIASLWGIYQAGFSLARTARYLRGLGQAEMDPLVLRAESGRAFGPFLLPADLGIFLAMVLPLTLRWLFRQPRGEKRLLAAAVLLVQVLGFAASRSYGAALSLAAAALLLLPFSRVRRKIPIWAGGFACGLGLAGGLFILRASEGISPLALRLRNWKAGWDVFRSHPLFGVGLGNFGDASTRHLVAGMNETLFAHNSYLQVMAEAGLPGLVLLLLGVVMLLRKIRVGLQGDADALDRLSVCLPAATFLVHNLFDFSAYLASLLTLFAALCALSTRPPLPRVPKPAVTVKGISGRRVALGVLLAGMVFGGLREARTAEMIRHSRWALSVGRPELSIQDLLHASRLNPAHPDPPAILSEIYLEKLSSEPLSRRAGETWARRAAALRPYRAYGHYMLSLYRLAAGDLGESWVDLSRARELYPGRELYRIQEGRLREMIDSVARRTRMPDGF